MRLLVERAEGVDDKRNPELSHEIAHQIKKQLLVSGEIDLVSYAGLPRSEKKSQRVFDNRIQDEIV
jgi:phenylacetate-coenzyme A ligase PaaK-like adenylate-forming protein